MKAMVLNGKNEPFSMEDRPDPVAGPGEAVARVITCGAGQTIHHVKMGRTPATYPIIIGHEITGEIVEVGAGVTNVAKGDAVTIWFYLTCGDCKWCRIGRETLCENFGGCRRLLRRICQIAGPEFFKASRGSRSYFPSR